ncbi:hypothetical protein [Erwinia sorbitola]|uniref:hypothetical protein n=1 Tax=Erwinia sorbitola TaxID=2681984 RepID=UPI001E292BA4|nr:hypothetical protein [Erwinia sorbitola]
MVKQLRFTRVLSLVPLLYLLFTLAPAHALDCGRPANLAEHTVCSSPQLTWLDGIYNDSFHDKLLEDPSLANELVKPWMKGIKGCTNNRCLRDSYLGHIARLYAIDRVADLSGVWWNTTTPQGNSGRIQISNQNASGFRMNATVKGGIYRSEFNGEVSFYSGIGFTDKIILGGDCAIIVVPLTDGQLRVSSDSLRSCSLLLPGDMSIDGIYTRSASDPRPPATLLTLGILPDSATDNAFRQLVGSDYQKYVDTATDFDYDEELDNIGATVVAMWFKGMANSRAAIIMTTPQGQIWAMRAEPAAGGKGVLLKYSTTERNTAKMPKTLSAWQARFIKPPH